MLYSGHAFRRDQLCLTNKDVLDHQLKWQAERTEDEKKRARRRVEAFRSQLSKVQKIRNKSEIDWNVTDYRTMLTYKKRPGDPATSSIKDKDILRALWFD